MLGVVIWSVLYRHHMHNPSFALATCASRGGKNSKRPHTPMILPSDVVRRECVKRLMFSRPHRLVYQLGSGPQESENTSLIISILLVLGITQIPFVLSSVDRQHKTAIHGFRRSTIGLAANVSRLLVIVGGLSRRAMSTGSTGVPAPPSARARALDPPYIENVLDAYAAIPDTYNLAMGVAHWGPPPNALKVGSNLLMGQHLHGYGPIGGVRDLVGALRQKLTEDNTLDLTNQEVMVTAGANQALTNMALVLCDPGDEAVICAPYYYSQKLALQIAQAKITTCRWDPDTLLADLKHLEELLAPGRTKVVVLSNPGNPTGAVCPESMLLQIVEMCKRSGTWLVLDQAYEHFVHDGAVHTSICAESVGYQGIMHVFSMSKSFGMAGWRVGYLVYPRSVPGLHEAMRSLQDTIPTHAVNAAQAVAHAALDDSGGQGGVQWTRQRVAELEGMRERMWSVVSRLAPGTVRTNGAFYFLLRLPEGVTEEEAVRVLATKVKVLVTPGSAFGAPGHLRVSYGSLPPSECSSAIDRLEQGLEMLVKQKGTSR